GRVPQARRRWHLDPCAARFPGFPGTAGNSDAPAGATGCAGPRARGRQPPQLAGRRAAGEGRGRGGRPLAADRSERRRTARPEGIRRPGSAPGVRRARKPGAMMMGANTAINIATRAGPGPGSAEGSPGPERSGGFPAALSAATAAKPREAVGDRDPRAAASDPGLAAALAALLSVIAPDSAGVGAEAGAESGALEDGVSGGTRL